MTLTGTAKKAQIAQNQRQVWERKVREAANGICGGCGGADHLRVKMLVPAEAGGLLKLSNGAVLCRACEMATDASREARETRRPINFWVSRATYDLLNQDRKSFSSMAALVRYLMDRYVLTPEGFEDLELFQAPPPTDPARRVSSRDQESGNEMKVNVFVGADSYEAFKKLLDARGMTVTSAICALIQLYTLESASRPSHQQTQQTPHGGVAAVTRRK